VSIRGRIRTAFLSLLKAGLKALPSESLAKVVIEVISDRTRNLTPPEGLKWLFGLDHYLYQLQGRLAVAYDGGIHTKHRHMRYHDFFVDRIQRGERVLDVGCGNGALAYDLAEKAGALVTAVDIDPENIATAIQRRPHVRVSYVVGDAVEAPPIGQFEVLVLSNVLEHIEYRTEFLDSLVNSLEPRRILIRVPLLERDWRVPLRKELGCEYRLDPAHFHEYTLETFAAEMHSAGLMVIHQEVRWGELWAETAAWPS
jgi:2-polyprenyl-3-methyl-5-hydroxy-6-metoxy-1,4-benzoquinol methylase